MLSDERIRQIAEDIYCSEGTHAEIEHSIRAALAEAAQSVPVVERNQCDGCNRGLQVCDDGLHREPSGHPVMACTRNKYTRSIPATELDALRKDADAVSVAAAKEHDARQAGIVRAVVLAYKEGKNGEAYHPGYTPHEAVAFEIGQRERR